MISKWRTVSRTSKRWLGPIARYTRDLDCGSTTNTSHRTFNRFLSCHIVTRGSIRRRRMEFNRVSPTTATVQGNFFYYRSRSCVRYCGAYVLHRNELNIERTFANGLRKEKRKKEKRSLVERSTGGKTKLQFIERL